MDRFVQQSVGGLARYYGAEVVGCLGGGAKQEELHHGGVASQGLIPVSRSWKEVNKSKDGVPSVFLRSGFICFSAVL